MPSVATGSLLGAEALEAGVLEGGDVVPGLAELQQDRLGVLTGVGGDPDGGRLAVDDDALAQHITPAGEAAAPHRFAEHGE